MGATVPNRLSVAHLLLWILGIGAMLAYHRDRLIAIREIADVPAWQTYFITIQSLGRSLAVGAGLAALVLVAYRSTRRIAGFPATPGHWLLLLLGTLSFTSIAVENIIHYVSKWTGLEEYGLHGDLTWSFVCKTGLPALAALVVAVIGQCASKSEGIFWRISLATIAFEQVSAILGCAALLSLYRFDRMLPGQPFEIYWMYTHWLSFAVVLSVVVASIVDFSKRGRDFLHWVGVASWIGFKGLDLAGSLLWVNWFQS